MKRDLIIDIGMHNGDDTNYYLPRGFNVLAIEAAPTLVQQAKDRFSEYIQKGKLEILNIAIADTEGEKDFYLCDTLSVWNTFEEEELIRRKAKYHSIKVPCKTFDWILGNYGIPFYLKIDIEGNDYLCIDALKCGNLPQYLSLETWGDNYSDKVKVLDQLYELGYTKFKCISQFNFIALEKPLARDAQDYQRFKEIIYGKYKYSKNLIFRGFMKLGLRKIISNKMNELETKFRTRDGYTFPEGSSGPFGEETPGKWMNIDEIKDVYSFYFEFFEKDKDKDVESLFWKKGQHYSFWNDFHATKD